MWSLQSPSMSSPPLALLIEYTFSYMATCHSRHAQLHRTCLAETKQNQKTVTGGVCFTQPVVSRGMRQPVFMLSASPADGTQSHRKLAGTPRFWCEPCGRSFIWESQLIAHMLTHTGERPFTCEICGKGFTQRGTLTRHTRTHQKIKPKLPPATSAKIESTITVKRSLPTGSDAGTPISGSPVLPSSIPTAQRVRAGEHEKRFLCTICGNRFTQRGSLNRHIRAHSKSGAESDNNKDGTDSEAEGMTSDTVSGLLAAALMAESQAVKNFGGGEVVFTNGDRDKNQRSVGCSRSDRWTPEPPIVRDVPVRRRSSSTDEAIAALSMLAAACSALLPASQ